MTIKEMNMKRIHLCIELAKVNRARIEIAKKQIENLEEEMEINLAEIEELKKVIELSKNYD